MHCTQVAENFQLRVGMSSLQRVQGLADHKLCILWRMWSWWPPVRHRHNSRYLKFQAVLEFIGYQLHPPWSKFQNHPCTQNNMTVCLLMYSCSSSTKLMWEIMRAMAFRIHGVPNTTKIGSCWIKLWKKTCQTFFETHGTCFWQC